MLYVELPIMLYMGSQSDSGKSNKRITNKQTNEPIKNKEE